MQVGEVRPAKAEDFEHFRRLAESVDGWNLHYDKQGTKVFCKVIDGSTIRLIKVVARFSDVSCSLMYDVLHDGDYRRCWDENMVECYEICQLDRYNDIGYYSIKCPTPMKNRDFVTQRSWNCTDDDFIIFNHTVYHKDIPVKKGFIRGQSILSGYFVQRKGEGCSVTYVSQVDLKGHLPKWLVNRASTKIAPKVVIKVHKAALGYQAWKAEHAPSYKPWIWPEQSIIPILRPEDVVSVRGDSPNGSDQEQEVIGEDPANYSSEENVDENIML
ncbi:START domain-containing protein 10-like [Montipora capricornis]|uniref:START domain-containing protein 10-like n=1 Tax=Montipora capricornis TaxID=246305 RepID=UPI0035F1BE20